MLNICVLVSGGGSNLQAIIDEIKKENINACIKLVLSNKKNAYGLARAEKENIENYFLNPKEYDNKTYNNKILSMCKERNIDLVVLAGYLKILEGDFLKEYRHKIINIHPSLIPSFCGDGFYGSKVHEKVLEYGVKVTGATVHFVDEGTDTGPIILQEAVKVLDSDNVEDIQKRVLEVEHRLLPEAVKLISEDRLVVDDRRVKVI